MSIVVCVLLIWHLIVCFFCCFSDPRTKDMFMNFGNPIPVWILTIAYLSFVTYIGPKFMKNRQAFSLTYFMVIYNIGLVFMSIYMFVEVSLVNLSWLYVLYENIDQLLPNKSHGPMHYKNRCHMCIQWTRVLYCNSITI